MSSEDSNEVTLGMVLSNIKDIQDTLKITIQQNNDLKEQNDALKREFLSFKTNLQCEVKALDKSVKEIKHSQVFIQGQYDGQVKMNDNILKSSINIEKEHNNLIDEITNLKKQLNNEILMRNNLEQYGRRVMLEVNGIPLMADENCDHLISSLATLISVPDFTPDKIDVAHRISSSPDSPIIVKFKNRTDRNSFFNSRSNLKGKLISDLGLPLSSTPTVKGKNKIFINESLTTANKTLFKSVRSSCQEKSFTYFWTRNGVIYARKNTDSHVIRINSTDDLKKIR